MNYSKISFQLRQNYSEENFVPAELFKTFRTFEVEELI